VLDAFHVVRLGTQVVDEVRRRVQQTTFGHRGHKDDPLYKIRGLLRHGVEHLTTDSLPASTHAWTPATRTSTSPSPGAATNSSDRPTTPDRSTAARSRRR
jgi:transposase